MAAFLEHRPSGRTPGPSEGALADAFGLGETLFDRIRKQWERHAFLVASAPTWLFAACIVSLIVARFLLGAPDNDWGAAGLVDADRILHGQALFEDPATGRPTWMYGPGQIWLNAALYALTGPSILWPRMLSLGASFATIALATIVSRRWLPRRWQVLAIATFVLIDGKVIVFGSTKPDALALLFAVAGLFVCFRPGLLRALVGGTLIAFAVLIKQTALVAVVVPLVALASEARWPSSKQLADALLVIVPVATMLVILRFFVPFAWFYFILVPGQYSADIAYRTFVLLLLQMIGGATGLWVAGVLLVRAAPPTLDPELLRRLRWAVCTFALTLLTGTLAYAKFGGGINSLMPCWFAMLVLFWLLVAALNEVQPKAIARPGVMTILALSVGAMLIPNEPVLATIDQFKAGARGSYLETLSRVRALHGSVLSPGDPSITLLTRHQYDRSVWLDLDIMKWPTALPTERLDRDYSADYIVTSLSDEVPKLRLRERGYSPIWSSWTYTIWSRSSPKAVGQL